MSDDRGNTVGSLLVAFLAGAADGLERAVRVARDAVDARRDG